MGCYIIMLQLMRAYSPQNNAGKQLQYIHVSRFELIKFMSFGLTLLYPHEEFLIPHPPHTKFNPRLPRPAASSTCT